MLNDKGGPIHPFAVGVTVMVAVTVAVVLLVAVKDGISPVPLAASPIDGVSLTHAKVVPEIELVKLIAVVVAPLQ